MAYAAKRPRALDLALSIVASESAAAPKSVFNAVIQSRGVILDELVAREKARSGSGPETASLNATAIQARQRYANLIVRSLQEQVPRAMLDEARQQKEDAERALAESSVDARTEMRRADISFNDVDEALPHDAVLVSFVLYDRTRIPVKEHRPILYKPIPSYGAFVQRAGASEVAFMPLGTAAWIDGLIKAWRIEAGGGSIVSGHSASQASIAYRTAGAALRRAVWDPLNGHVAGAARTFIVPDGLLNIVNVAALPDRNGHYLLEGTSTIHYLSTERDLVMPADQPPGRGLFAVGGPTFGQGATKSAAITPALRSGCDGFGDIHFEDLPGSRREVIEIGKFWPTARCRRCPNPDQRSRHGNCRQAESWWPPDRPPRHAWLLPRQRLLAWPRRYPVGRRACQEGPVRRRLPPSPRIRCRSRALPSPAPTRRAPPRRSGRRHPDRRGDWRAQPAGHGMGRPLRLRHGLGRNQGWRGCVRTPPRLPGRRRADGHHEPLVRGRPLRHAVDARPVPRDACVGGSIRLTPFERRAWRCSPRGARAARAPTPSIGPVSSPPAIGGNHPVMLPHTTRSPKVGRRCQATPKSQRRLKRAAYDRHTLGCRPARDRPRGGVGAEAVRPQPVPARDRQRDVVPAPAAGA